MTIPNLDTTTRIVFQNQVSSPLKDISTLIQHDVGIVFVNKITQLKPTRTTKFQTIEYKIANYVIFYSNIGQIS